MKQLASLVTTLFAWFQLRTQEIGNINDVLRLSFCAKRLENKVTYLKVCSETGHRWHNVLFVLEFLKN